MNLRERTVKGYSDAYLRSERKLVTDMLRTGCLTSGEWEELSQKLNKAAKDFEKGENTAEEFIEKRKQIDAEIRKSRKEKDTRMTREEAQELYEDYRERHQKLLEEAFMESRRTIPGFLIRMPVLRAKHAISVLKNT